MQSVKSKHYGVLILNIQLFKIILKVRKLTVFSFPLQFVWLAFLYKFNINVIF